MTTLRPPATSPFEQNHADPWARTFIDLPSLNAPASDAIASAIHDVRKTARRDGAEIHSKSILVLGPAGAGKTHLFARLRRKLGPRAVFVHLRPLVGTEMTPRYVLDQVMRQLVNETDGFKQLDALVGASLAHLRNEPPDLPRAFLDDCRALDEGKRRELTEWAVEQVLERHTDADDMYMQRLIEAPFATGPTQRASLAWLAGRDLEEAQMKRLGVSSSLAEERIVPGLKTLGLFAAPGTPIVLVFDQLENLMDAEQTGSRVRAYANLVAELFDTMKGFVLVQMALDSQWERSIFPELSPSQKTRLAGHPVHLGMPTPEQKRQLLERWVAELPTHPEPFPWPFGERRVARWCNAAGMTPRMLMIECLQALAEGTPDEEEGAEEEVSPPANASEIASPDDALASAWENHLAAARVTLDEASADRRSADPARLVGGIASLARFLTGVKTLKVDARLSVQLVVHREGQPKDAALCLLHQTHPRSVAAALDKARDASAKCRMLALRERALEFPSTWKQVIARRAELTKAGVRFLTLERDDAAKLLALESFVAAARSSDLEDARGRALDEAEVTAWIGRTLALSEWSLSRALLGTEEAEDDAEPAPPAHAGAATSPSDTATTIHAILAHLRVASLERLVREVARVKPEATRADVVDALGSMNDRVRWFGRAIVAFEERA